MCLSFQIKSDVDLDGEKGFPCCFYLGLSVTKKSELVLDGENEIDVVLDVFERIS
jgi:hypothetical protein